jgi:SPP1 gp7 family putative phage head morphogenesis protein
MPQSVDLSYAIGLPPEDAINYFRSKGYAFSWNWYDVWQDAHAKAFTVAKAMKLDLLQDIRNAVDKALVNGTTLATFRDELEPILKAKGWWGKDADTGAQLGSPHRLETIFRTNLQSAYMAGRYKQQMENVDDRPYWQYIAVMDSRTRPAHSALNGKVFRFDDVFWDTHFPPCGFRCRCRTRAYTAQQVKDKGLTVESGKNNMVWEDKKISGDITRPVAGYRDPKTGKITFTDPGWSSNPGKEHWKIDLSKYDKKLQAIANKIASLGVKDQADCQLWLINNIGKYGENSNGAILPLFEDIGKAFMSTNTSGKLWINTTTRAFEIDGKNISFNASDELVNAMKAIGNRKLTFKEEYSIECLWHELLHNKQIFKPNYQMGGYELNLMETVNQWLGRHTYQTLMSDMGTAPVHQSQIIKGGYGYNVMVRRFNDILSKFGVDSKDIVQEVESMHKNMSADDYIAALPDIILKSSKKSGYTKRQRSILVDVLGALGEDDNTFIPLLDAI